MAGRSGHEQRVLKLAQSAEAGGQNNWHDVACELRMRGEPLALQILGEEPY